VLETTIAEIEAGMRSRGFKPPKLRAKARA
jgi:hypothetical protein